MIILNTKGVILTRDQAEEDNGSFVPFWKTSVWSCFEEAGDSLSALPMHATLIKLCFTALVVGVDPHNSQRFFILKHQYWVLHQQGYNMLGVIIFVFQWTHDWQCKPSCTYCQHSLVQTVTTVSSIKLKHCFIFVARCFTWNLAVVLWTQVSPHCFKCPLTISDHPGTHMKSPSF